MTKISYIDIVRNVHIDWVTADLEQEATRKGSGTSKRGARVVSSKSRKTPILGVHSDSTLRDARANSESGRVPAGSVGPLPILNLNRTCESCRHLASQLVATPRP